MYHSAIDGDLLDDVFALFPKSQLVITHGPLVLGGIMPTYRVSTVSGMSGSPVIINGKVRGHFHTHYFLDNEFTNPWADRCSYWRKFKVY